MSQPVLTDLASMRLIRDALRKIQRTPENPDRGMTDYDSSSGDMRDDVLCGVVITRVKPANGLDMGCGRVKIVNISCDGHCTVTERVEVVWTPRPTSIAVNPEKVYIIVRDYVSGVWMIEGDEADAADSDSTSTTAEPTTTPHPIQCEGVCRWVANADLQWEAENPEVCVPATSTTTTPGPTTTPDPEAPTTTSSTTTPDCNRCSSTTTTGEPTSTTTTTEPTTSSTTTEAPCACEFPTFCPTIVGQCTYTNCLSGIVSSNQYPLPCSTSTTTGAPTTTTEPTTTPACGCPTYPCGWKLVGGIYYATGPDPCGDRCVCARPAAPSGLVSQCSEIETDCIFVDTTTPNPPCDTWCAYAQVDNEYHTIFDPSNCGTYEEDPTCWCPPPPPLAPGEHCAVLRIRCRSGLPGGPTTTPDPCTSSTPPPTTTPDDCGLCRFIPMDMEAGTWMPAGGFSCTGGCYCLEPDHPPYDSCEIAETPCTGYPTTTTTTTGAPTTTTTTEEPPTTTNGECPGTCLFTWNVGANEWLATSNTCLDPGVTCWCCPPEDPGEEGDTYTTYCAPGEDFSGACNTTPACEIPCMWRCERTLVGEDPFDPDSYHYFWDLQTPGCDSPCSCNDTLLLTCNNSRLFQYRSSNCENGFSTTTTMDPSIGACCVWNGSGFTCFSDLTSAGCFGAAGDGAVPYEWFSGEPCLDQCASLTTTPAP